MANQDLSVVKSLVVCLRKVTRLVQILPFIYLWGFALYLIFGVTLSERTLCQLDAMFALPLFVIVTMLILGHFLKLCVWFKGAVLLPLASRLVNYIDVYLYSFTQEEILIINTLMGLGIILFTIISYRRIINAA